MTAVVPPPPVWFWETEEQIDESLFMSLESVKDSADASLGNPGCPSIVSRSKLDLKLLKQIDKQF